ncbi:MAG TPA: glycosyltransferase [Candidatus Xenobia bacterium]|jgi:glycosyltransferase involved in cell wall biosynthesis
MPISVVIPTFNRRDSLEVVLPALLNQTYPADQYELLLSDSGSTDGTDELVHKLNAPNLRHLVHPNNGRSGARNDGVKEARFDTILFTDADIIADPKLLEKHAQVHQSQAGPTAVVGCEVQVDTLEEYEAVKRDPWGRGRHLHQIEGDTGPRPLSWLYFLTGNASVNRQALLDVGLFDENFTNYGHEDLELGYRLEKHGVKMLFYPEAINYHWHPVTFTEKCRKMHLSGFATVRMWRKHRDPSIKFKLGMNPFALGWHRLVAEDGFVMRMCKAKAQQSKLASEVLLQYHYLDGVEEGLRTLGR